MDINDLKKYYVSIYEKGLVKLDDYRRKLDKAIFENNDVEIDRCNRRIIDMIDKIKERKTYIDFMRANSDEDLEERNIISHMFPQMIKTVIPDNIPLVFHGNRNIGVVLEIIKSGGLFTPEQRGVSEKSFAVLIDVTYKSNIMVSCEFAEPGMNSFMPYGAIFAFLPLENEIENVLNTGENSQVIGGVEGVNFREEPDRLIGIITTVENKERIRSCCLESGWPVDKVFTYQEFVLLCERLYSEENSIHRVK